MPLGFPPCLLSRELAKMETVQMLINRIRVYFVDQTPEYFPPEEVKRYSQCTYMTEKEINKLYAIFANLGKGRVNQYYGDIITRLSFETIQSLPELVVCPFAERLCEVFCTDPKRKGLDFEDFLNMMSAFGHRAPWNLKAAYAFQIFDYNEDLAICASDIELTINYLTGKICIVSTKLSIYNTVLRSSNP